MIIITGPTSSGKTSLAIKLAQKFGAELISADSRQIYKHMDIGTGKRPIDAAESEYEKGNRHWVIDGVKIHMYDVVSPDQEYSSFQYVSDAKGLIRKIPLPIIVGGTGFYIDSLAARGTDYPTQVDNEYREELSKKSTAELVNMVPQDYLSTWNNSEKNNPSRLIRAIQIHAQTGEWPAKNREVVDPSKNNLVIELTAPRDFLYAKVDKWADTIWDPLLNEVRELDKLGYKNTEPMKGIIYRSAQEYLRGVLLKEKALEQMKFDLHKYIRRQQTWFKKYKHSVKVDITEKSFDSSVFACVKSYLDER